MDITQDRVLTWAAPTARIDGSSIAGTLTYIVEFVDRNNAVKQFPSATTTLTLNPVREGIVPGAYTVYVRAQEDYNGVGRVSARSNGVPLVLESVVEPNPPTNLRVE